VSVHNLCQGQEKVHQAPPLVSQPVPISLRHCVQSEARPVLVQRQELRTFNICAVLSQQIRGCGEGGTLPRRAQGAGELAQSPPM
jgi:hypothetical protein